jgi:uncharacterized protein (DUF927 family)
MQKLDTISGGKSAQAIDFKALNTAALDQATRVLEHFLPGGKLEGDEYTALNPTRPDKKAGSFRINTKTGLWSDFATGDSGGDLIALVGYLKGAEPLPTAKLLAEFLGMTDFQWNQWNRGTGQAKLAQVPKSERSVSVPYPDDQCGTNGTEWRPIVPSPPDALMPDVKHHKHGEPVAQYMYRSTDGNIGFIQRRFETPTGKEFVPLTFGVLKGKRGWHCKAPLKPPPYNLDKLAANPAATVILCEGEKSADAAGVLFPDCVPTTSLNGSKSAKKTDWSSLKGRNILIWPDNDEPGHRYATECSKLLDSAGATSVKRINLAIFANFYQEGLPSSWDAADALADGIDSELIAALKAESNFVVDPQEPASNSSSESPPEAQSDAGLPRGFSLRAKGVFFTSKDEESDLAKSQFICAPLQVLATTCDEKNKRWGRVLNFKDPLDHQHTCRIPASLLAGSGEELRKFLLDEGLNVDATRKNTPTLLATYIKDSEPGAHMTWTSRTGWHTESFVLPDRVITAPDSSSNQRYHFESGAEIALGISGSLADWQREIGTLCSGNSRLVFAACIAFAGPLLYLARNIETGGFHLRGSSSQGKTSCQFVAASVYGSRDFMVSWRATDNGLESVAAEHSDLLLCLDELGQVDPRVVGDVVYMLSAERSKERASRNGTRTKTKNWRLLLLSSGEIGLADHMRKAGLKPAAGQEVRLLDIPADAEAGLGSFENLHGHQSGESFAKHLNTVTRKIYGSPAIAFITKIVENGSMLRDELPRILQKIQQTLLADKADGQVSRAATRFALVAVAGELATEYGITGWKPGEATSGVARCFQAWLDARGTLGALEKFATLSEVQKFFELNADSRFIPLNTAEGRSEERPVFNSAGYRKRMSDASGEYTEYWVFPEVFRSEICKGADPRLVIHWLKETGALVPERCSGAAQQNKKVPGEGKSRRFYVINSKVFEAGSMSSTTENKHGTGNDSEICQQLALSDHGSTVPLVPLQNG